MSNSVKQYSMVLGSVCSQLWSRRSLGTVRDHSKNRDWSLPIFWCLYCSFAHTTILSIVIHGYVSSLSGNIILYSHLLLRLIINYDHILLLVVLKHAVYQNVAMTFLICLLGLWVQYSMCVCCRRCCASLVVEDCREGAVYPALNDQWCCLWSNSLTSIMENSTSSFIISRVFKNS